MPGLFIEIAIVQDGQALLVRNADGAEGWSLPAAMVSAQESPAQTALRLAGATCQTQVEMERLVGFYSQAARIGASRHTIVFTARNHGAQLSPRAAYFSAGALPADLAPGCRRRVSDALGGAGCGLAWLLDRAWPFSDGLTREGLYQACASSGLSPAQFYQSRLGRASGNGDILEVGGAASNVQAAWRAFPGQRPPEGERPDLGVNVAVIREDKILLTLRKDFEVWCLPGGGVEEGESLAQGAQRETQEETGLEVKLDRCIGIYCEPRWFKHGLHVVVFAAHDYRGELRAQPAEVLEQAFFGRGEIPANCLYGHRQRALDALDGRGNALAWRQAETDVLEAGIPYG
ncbi:MAG: NUDIX domain-containing protein [Chloroflexi bacterium]|nr:NUDIX domain-containing protein [Chloroflexota bacterium]